MSHLAVLDAPVRSPHIAVANFAEAAVAFDARNRELHELNPTAVAVWELLDGRSVSDICDVLAVQYAVAREVIEVDVAALLESFGAIGMLDDGAQEPTRGQGELRLSRAETVTGRWGPRLEDAVGRLPGIGSVGVFRAGGFTFRVLVDDDMIATELGRVLRSLRVDQSESLASHGSIATYALVRRVRGWTLHFENRPLGRRNDPDLAVSTLLWHLNQQVVAHRGSKVALHAGCVAGHDGAAVLPGVSNAGKSTLVAALVQQGWGYLSDEIAMVEPATLAVEPIPKAFAFDPGSFAVFPDARPDVADPLTYGLARKWHVDPAHFGEIGRAGRVRVVVGPEFVPGAETTLLALEPRETLDLLVASAFDLDRDGFLCLAEIARTAPGYRLQLGDAASAVDALRPLLPVAASN